MEKTPQINYLPEKLEKNYLEFENLCKKYLEKYVIAYSVKTNSYKPLIKQLNKLGSNFEVASLNEIKLTKLSKKPKIFNSPCKTEEELQIALDNKFLINIDSKSEVNKIAQLLENQKFSIGIRISLNESKFGFSPEQLDETIDYIKSKNLNIICLQFHTGTNQTLKSYQETLIKAKEITKDLTKNHNLKLKYIDLGGGFPDKLQLKNLNCSLKDYFICINEYFKEFNTSIILEPGRCLVADAFELITKVHVIKQKPDKTYAILDVGINILPKITLSQYKFSKISENQNPNDKKQTYTLAGPLLFKNDTLGNFNGHLEEGDVLKVENIGAYCYNFAWELSYKKPEIR